RYVVLAPRGAAHGGRWRPVVRPAGAYYPPRLTVGTQGAVLRHIGTLRHECRVHCGQVEIAPRLFTDAFGINTSQRHSAHLVHKPGKVRGTQVPNHLGCERCRWDNVISEKMFDSLKIFCNECSHYVIGVTKTLRIRNAM